MEQSPMPNRLFGLPLSIGGTAEVASMLPRLFLQDYDLHDAQLGAEEQGRFIAALPRRRPTATGIRTLARAVEQHVENHRPLVLCWEGIDYAMRESLQAAGMPYIIDRQNAYLPFIGAMATKSARLPAPAPLSPQAQRIFLNLLTGRWKGATAGKLASLCNKSNASLTKYLAEIAAIWPSLVRSEGRMRVLTDGNLTSPELLELFEPYLVPPASTVYRLAKTIDRGALSEARAAFAGESALAFYTDLAFDPSHIVVAMEASALKRLRRDLSNPWEETAWGEPSVLDIEVWSYSPAPLSDTTMAAHGLACLEPAQLYPQVYTAGYDDVRLQDAVEQLREQLCQRS